MNSIHALRRLIHAVPLCLSLVACGGSMAPAANPSAQEKIDSITSRIDEVLARQQNASEPGVSIVIASQGSVVYSRSKGLADIQQVQPITTNTAFETASISKTMTAVALLQLVQRQRVALTDSVLDWLPELPASWRGISIHHLLSHQSGVPDFLTNIPVNQVGALDGLTNQGLLQRFVADGRLDFAPGSNAAYSSSNYVLLAEVVARATGQTFGQYLQENIFAPAGMNSTHALGQRPALQQAAALNFGRDSRIIGISLATVGPTGIFSTASDLRLFVSHLLDGSLLPMDWVQTMTTIQSGRPVLGSGEYYGYGWFLAPGSRPLTLFAHTGRLDGYRSVLRVNLAKDVFYIVLSNGGDATDRVVEAVRGAVQDIYE